MRNKKGKDLKFCGGSSSVWVLKWRSGNRTTFFKDLDFQQNQDCDNPISIIPSSLNIPWSCHYQLQVTVLVLSSITSKSNLSLICRQRFIHLSVEAEAPKARGHQNLRHFFRPESDFWLLSQNYNPPRKSETKSKVHKRSL